MGPVKMKDLRLVMFKDEATTFKPQDIPEIISDVFAAVRSVDGKHEIVGRVQLFKFWSDLTSADVAVRAEIEPCRSGERCANTSAR